MRNRREVLQSALGWAALAALPAALPRAVAAGPDDKDEGKKGEKETGLTVPLEFCDTVDSRTAHKGDVVELKVVDDVQVDGRLRFRKDAAASGIIEAVHKPERFGKKAEIKMRLDWVRDVNGDQVPLSSYNSGKRFEPGAGGASLGGALLLGPIGLLGGALIKGGHLVIKKGTRIQGRVLDGEEKK